MELLIEKLNQIKDNKQGLVNWSLKEKKQLLDIYLIISKKESHIFKLIYSYHGCDSWEDIFRDVDIKNLEDKVVGVEVAIEEITKQINKEKQKYNKQYLNNENFK
jgi:hypothetical protein